jgi:hypothetical protein
MKNMKNMKNPGRGRAAPGRRSFTFPLSPRLFFMFLMFFMGG